MLILPLILPLGGCVYPMKLVDQRSFRATATPSAADMARARLPALPLATIRFDDPDYRDALDQAIGAAQTRKPDAAFDVIVPIPQNASKSDQDQITSQGQQDAQQIATAIAEYGVAPDHIFLGLRSDPGTPPREVRVYVR